MKLLALALLVVAATCYAEEDRDKRQTPGYYASTQGGARYPTTPQAFRPSQHDDELLARNVVTAATPKSAPRRPVPDNQREYQHQAPVYRAQQVQQPQRGQPAQRGQYAQQQLQLEEEEELEEEKPDRLTLLLPQSKFDCAAKKTGYYADDGLGCEVFHYCQDNSKHSWICPEGFQFHQVHLICMPPSSDNICAQSSDYHFVNDYLYRPINTEEHERKPNVSLRYADRYYPENYYDEEAPEHVQAAAPPPRQQPVHHQQQRRPVPVVAQRPVAAQRPVVQYVAQRPVTAQPRPVQQFVTRPASNQVFHSPEEVNIPLQHRRPVAPSPPSRNTYQERDDDDSEEDEEYEYEDPPYGRG